MIEKVLRYIESQRFVNIGRLKKDLDISEEDWDLISLQLRDLGYIKDKGIIAKSRCELCPYNNTCEKGVFSE